MRAVRTLVILGLVFAFSRSASAVPQDATISIYAKGDLKIALVYVPLQIADEPDRASLREIYVCQAGLLEGSFLSGDIGTGDGEPMIHARNGYNGQVLSLESNEEGVLILGAKLNDLTIDGRVSKENTLPLTQSGVKDMSGFCGPKSN